MKVFTFIIYLFLLSFQICSQASIYENRPIKQSEITTLFSYYNQDGNHSAITGGEGTEKLSVYSITSDLKFGFDSIHQVFVDLGLDFISSASTDKIDFRVSSASSHDQRLYTDLGYERLIRSSDLTIGASLSFSLESDYYSRGIHLWASHKSKSGSQQVDFNLQIFQDDLRWRKRFYEPTELIYPEELRDTSWFDIHHRNSYNFTFGYRRDLNRRFSFGFYPGIIFQKGLLSTPYHRVYFDGETDPKVENLPRSRVKYPIGFQLNGFLTNRLIMRSYYQFYCDDFGITANLFKLDFAYKTSAFFTIIPSFRFYTQSASDFFRPFKMHTPDQKSYTSDYDLSGFNSYLVGLELKSSSNKRLFKKAWLFDQFSFRYSYYKRSDGLYAHIFSTLFNLKR